MKYIYFIFISLSLCSCAKPTKQAPPTYTYPVIGTIERINPLIDDIIPPDAKIEKIAFGITWAEGPLWIEEYRMLLCSDVKMNRIYRWTDEAGLSVFLEPSGFTGDSTDSREKGSNGLVLNPKGELIM